MAPVADRLFDRLKRPAHDDRSRDHGAGRDDLLDGERRAGAENGGLEGEAGGLGAGGEAAGAVARPGLVQAGIAVVPLPALAQAAQHVHGAEHLGVALAVGREDLGLVLKFRRIGKRAPRGQLVQRGDGEEHEGAAGRDEAEPGVQQEQDAEIDRGPRGVEQGEGSLA